MKSEEDILHCENCNCDIDTKSNNFQEYDTAIYCQECFDDLFSYCDYCENYVPTDDILYIESEGKYVCDNCKDGHFGRCDNCGEDYHIDRLFPYSNGYLCESCYENNYFTCESCGEICHIDNYYGDGYCSNCFNDINDNGLYNYSYKPSPIFYGKNDLYFGIELEIEANGQNIQDVVVNLPEFVYAKEDGSLENGLEIVSHPLSWQWLKDNKSQWEKILDLRHEGFTSYNTDTCGFHVHLSKIAFSGLHLFKFLKLFYENPKFILAISRRKKDNLCRYASLESEESIIYKAKTKGNGNTSRYTAVNLENRDTVEVRVFRGTLAPQGFWRNLEFCKAAFEFTKVSSIKNINESIFCDYVRDNATEYPHLYQFLSEKGFISNLFVKGKINVYDNLQADDSTLES